MSDCGEGAKEEERVFVWEELGDDVQWWNSMVVAELGAVEKQQQESPPPASPDKDDDNGGEQPTSSPPRGALSGTHLTFSCRAFVDGMHRQAVDAQRGRYFRRWRGRVENMRGKKEIGRAGGLLVAWSSASSRSLGRNMDGGEGAARYESVYARKRRSSPAARVRVQKGTYCF